LGIGLSLARTLVAMHGGTIEAHSNGVGQGSEFAIRLPRIAGQVEEKPDKVNSLPTTKGMSGMELSTRLRKQSAFSGAKMIAVTGCGQNHDCEPTIEAGFDHHLVKPVEFDRVLELLQR
jgi:CheY-like chemotaxis protein